MATEINREEFLGISFSHHMEILHKTRNLQEVLFYIHQTILHKWDKYDLRDRLKANLYAVEGSAPNNFDLYGCILAQPRISNLTD